MPSITGEYAKPILAAMHGLLKPLAYRKRGRTFRRERGDVVSVVNFQSIGDYALLGRLHATVNLGVFSRPLHAALFEAGYAWTKGDAPSVWGCHCRWRLGDLMPDRQDRWWDASDVAEAQRAAAEIADALVTYGIPALERLTSSAALRELWAGRQNQDLPKFTTGIMEENRFLRLLGEPGVPDEEASRALAAAESRQGMAKIAQALNDARERLGIRSVEVIGGDPENYTRDAGHRSDL